MPIFLALIPSFSQIANAIKDNGFECCVGTEKYPFLLGIKALQWSILETQVFMGRLIEGGQWIRKIFESSKLFPRFLEDDPF